MSVTQKLKTVVSLGGVVDASFGRMSGAINKSMASATKKVKTLEKEQVKLSKSIEKAREAGKDVSYLEQEYQELTKQIAKAKKEAKGFHALGSIRDVFAGGATLIKDVGVAAVGTTASVLGLVTVTNSATAEQNALAKSYGMSIAQFTAWGGVAKNAGLDAESTGDLVEELSNKFGEFKALGEQSSVSDVFGKLGIKKDMLDGLSAAEQFEFVMKRLNKVTDSQEAASLADMLFGGEANKLVTYIHGTGKGIDELLKKQKGINKLTTAGADGATQYQKAWSKGLSVVSTSWQDISGKVGGKLAPVIDQLSTKISTFVDTHQTQINAFVDNVVTGITTFCTTVYDVASAVNTAVQAIGGWGTVLNVVLGIVAAKGIVQFALFANNIKTLVTTISMAGSVMKAFNLIVKANPIGLAVTAISALISGLVILAEKFGIIEKFFGDDDEEEKEPDKKKPAQKGTVKKPRSYSAYDTPVKARHYGDYHGYGQYALYKQGEVSKPQPTASADTPINNVPDVPAYPNYGDKAKAATKTIQQNTTHSSQTHITNRVEKIEVITSPEQDPKAVGQGIYEVINTAGGQQMYDENYGV